MTWIWVIKLLGTAVGLLCMLGYLFAGLIQKDNSKFKKAGLALVVTFCLLVLLTAIEFVAFSR